MLSDWRLPPLVTDGKSWFSRLGQTISLRMEAFCFSQDVDSLTSNEGRLNISGKSSHNLPSQENLMDTQKMILGV